jgi:hypothetical protein
MKKPLIIITLCVLSISIMQAQDYSREAGKVTQYEAKMTTFAGDPDAEAVILYEIGDYHFEGDYNTGQFMLYMKKSMKIKILKQAGLKYGDIEIPLYESGNNIERLDIERAITYNIDNGNITKTVLDTKTIYEEKMKNN